MTTIALRVYRCRAQPCPSPCCGILSPCKRWVTDVPWQYAHDGGLAAADLPRHRAAAHEQAHRISVRMQPVCAERHVPGGHLSHRPLRGSLLNNEREGGGRAAEYYHIRSPTVTSPHSIVLSAVASTMRHASGWLRMG